jgi:hypothetical protein
MRMIFVDVGIFHPDSDDPTLSQTLCESWAKIVAAELWNAGFVPLVESLMANRLAPLIRASTLHSGLQWLAGQCDAILSAPHLKASPHSRLVRQIAQEQQMPLFYHVDDLVAYFEARERDDCAA